MARRGELPKAAFVPYVAAHFVGAMLGAWLAHAMFDMTILQFSGKVRSGTGQWIAEAVATAGLLLTILRAPAGKASATVAARIGAAHWFTASTSFANPAAAFGRMFSDSFAGIAPASVGGFVPAIVEYLVTPPVRAKLVALIAALGVPVRDVLRTKGTPYDALKLGDPGLSDTELIDAMVAHPILMNRPIVVSPLGTRLCRPSEQVLDILPLPQRASFAKEDGERVIDDKGRRVAP